MSQDDYGVEDKMDDQQNQDFDQEDSQNLQSDYSKTPSKGQDIQDQDIKDKDQDSDQNQNSDLQSVPEQDINDNKYDVIQQEQVIYDKPNSERITSPFMTKYEKARIIGVRATQISKNSPLYLTADSNSLMNWDPLTIAQKQLSEKKIPFIIRRYLPDGSFEDWKIAELKTFD